MFFVTAGLTFFISLSPSWLLRFLFLLQKRGKGPEKTLPNWCLLTSGTLGWWGSRYSGKFQVLGKSSSVRSSFPGLHELVRVTPNNWVRHGKLTEEMRQPLDFAAGWPGALLSVPSPGIPTPCPGSHTCTQSATCRMSWSTDPGGLPMWWVLPQDALPLSARSHQIIT